MERLPRINNAAIFPIIFCGAAGAALVVPVWLLVTRGGASAAVTMFAFSFPGFLLALLVPVAATNVVAPFASSELRLLLILLMSVGIGWVLPRIIGFMFPVPPNWGAAAGLVGGVICAALWAYFERHPEAARDVTPNNALELDREA